MQAAAAVSSYRKILDGVWRPQIGQQIFYQVCYSRLVAIADGYDWSKKTYNNALSVLRRAFDFGYRDRPAGASPGATRRSRGKSGIVSPKSHRSAERGLSLERLTLSPEAGNGELAKNSARVPTRLVLRFDSPAEAAATVLRALRLIFFRRRVTWKPWVCWNLALQSFRSKARESDRATRVC